jgi:hypothetical protein
MNEQDEVNERDRRLLEEIEQIALQGNVERQQEDSLYGFCAHLASTVPEAGHDYQQQLHARLSEKWQEQQAVWKRETLVKNDFHSSFLASIQRQFKSITRPQSPLRINLALVLATLLVVSLVAINSILPTRTVVRNILKQIEMGMYPEVAQVESNPMPRTVPTPENQRTVETVIGPESGMLSTGIDQATRTFTDLQQAQAQVGFELRTPTYLPDGYSLQEIKLPLAESSQMALLIYNGPGGEITLLQGLVGLTPASQPSQAVFATVNVTNTIFKKEAMIAGYPAAWIDGKKLEWKTDSYFFELSGNNLPLIEAPKIAESVQ